jgi:Tol biopolymer transport system component
MAIHINISVFHKIFFIVTFVCLINTSQSWADTAGFSCESPCFSPSGEYIAFTRTVRIDDKNESSSVCILRLKDRKIIREIPKAMHPSWSPDGSEILFAADDRSSLRISKLNSNTSVPLFSSKDIFRYISSFYTYMSKDGDSSMSVSYDDPFWSKNGVILFCASFSGADGGDTGVYHYNTKTREFLFYQNSILDHEPVYSPETNLLIVCKAETCSNNLFFLSDRGCEHRITMRNIGENINPAISPNGKRIAYFRSDYMTKLLDISFDIEEYHTYTTNIYVFDLKKSEGNNSFKGYSTSDLQIKLTNGGFNKYPAWSPDGRKIVFCRSEDPSKDENYRLYIMDLDIGKSEKVEF